MNSMLSLAAITAVKALGFDRAPHHCQKWVREVVESVYGTRFDHIIHQPSAKEAARAFVTDGRYVVPLEHGSLPGDLLYRTHGSGGAGHVGIRVEGNRVAENSSVHWDGEKANADARGFRSLVEFGHYDVIVRLPSP